MRCPAPPARRIVNPSAPRAGLHEPNGDVMSANLVSSDGIANASRRDVLKAGAALTLSVMVARSAVAEAATSGGGKALAAAAPFAPNDFVRISSDDVVTIVSKHLEMGQG